MPLMTWALARPRALTALITALVAAAWTLVVAAPAHAHTELRVSQPEQGQTVEQLNEVRLEFTSALLEIGAELTVVDAAGAQQVLEPEFPSENAVTGRVEQPLASGDAQLVWRVVAEDGHPIEGTIDFTSVGAEPTPEPEPTAVSTEPAPVVTATSPSATASAVPEPSPSAAAADGDGSAAPPWWVWPALGLAALGGAGVALLVAKTRGRP